MIFLFGKMAPLTIGGFEVPWIDTVRPEDTTSMAPYKKQTRKTEVLPKGWKLAENTRALPCDIIYDQNIAIPLRDGVKVGSTVTRSWLGLSNAIYLRSIVIFFVLLQTKRSPPSSVLVRMAREDMVSVVCQPA